MGETDRQEGLAMRRRERVGEVSIRLALRSKGVEDTHSYDGSDEGDHVPVMMEKKRVSAR